MNAPSSPRTPLLQVDNIHKRYGSNEVLKGVSLQAYAGDVISLIGSSGSGKSTLLRCINLLESIDDGQIFLDGQEISDPLINVDDVRRRLGMVFQSFNLFPHKTVLENITLSPIPILVNLIFIYLLPSFNCQTFPKVACLLL
jgi:polar amino acid transport system ATP-binding protein